MYYLKCHNTSLLLLKFTRFNSIRTSFITCASIKETIENIPFRRLFQLTIVWISLYVNIFPKTKYNDWGTWVDVNKTLNETHVNILLFRVLFIVVCPFLLFNCALLFGEEFLSLLLVGRVEEGGLEERHLRGPLLKKLL